jgi:PKD repeat protein
MVHVLPVASFTYSPTTNLSIFTSINFFDSSIDLDGTIISWLWDFGDNTTSSSQNPTHMYSNKGIYTINLTIIDNDGHVDYSSQFITIINLSPIADFTYSPERTIAEQDIIFTDLSEDPEGKNISYFWDFGDDSESNEKNPIHRYTEYGTYTVNLTVTDDEGATNSHSTIFTIKLSSSIIFSVFPSIITVEDSVNISGSLSPSFEGIDIRLTYNMPGGPTFIRTITTGSGGIFSDSYIPDATGPWSVISSWNGNSVFEGVSSLETFAVSNISTYLSCSVSQAIIILGEEVTVAGSLSPKLIGKQLDLIFTRPDSSTLHISVLTDTVSDYTHTLIPNMPGNWSIVASWIGEDKYDQTSNSSASFTVQAAPKASFTYSPSSNSSILSLITFSDTSIDVDGTIISWLWDFGDNTSSSIQYPTHIYEDADTYSVTLTVTDNDGYTDTTSHTITIQEATVAPSPVLSSITISVSVFAVPLGGSPVITSGVALGSLINVSGSIHPLISDVPVTLTYTKPDGSTFARNVTTNLGDYTDTFTPDMVGTWDVSTSWEGQAIILGASSSSESFTILQLSTSITCSVLAYEVPLGSSISISGSITPPIRGTTITLTYTRPDGSTFTRTVTTNPGDYTDIYKPDVEGSWTVIASWDGDSIYDSSSSSSKSFTIKKYGCLIATATYGSELSPQVQFLRGFRDNTVLTTFAGSSFMNVFNEFYYSFSPSVASIIAENSILRTIMKGVLYPLIGILHLSSTIFSSFSFAVELGVILAGLLASALIGVVYVLPLALIFSFIKKIKISRKIIHIMGLIWFGSIMTLFIAEVSNSPLIMMISTSVFVIVTLSTTVLTFLRILTKRLI